MPNAILIYTPDNKLSYWITGKISRYFEARELRAEVGGKYQQPGMIELLRLDANTNIPDGIIFIKTTTGMLLLTHNLNVIPDMRNIPSESAMAGQILDVQFISIPNLSVDDTQKHNYSIRNLANNYSQTAKQLKILNSYELSLNDLNSPLINILQNSSIKMVSFDELNVQMSDVVSFYIYPQLDSAGNNIGVFIHRNGPIYLTKLRYDNINNRIFPPV